MLQPPKAEFTHRSQRWLFLKEFFRDTTFRGIETWVQKYSTIGDSLERSWSFVRESKTKEHLKAKETIRITRKSVRKSYLSLPKKLVKLYPWQYSVVHNVRWYLASFRVHCSVNLDIHTANGFQIFLSTLKVEMSLFGLTD